MGFIWNIMLSFSNEELWVDGEDEPVEPLECKPLERINAWIDSESSILKGRGSEHDEHDGNGRLVELIGPTYDDNAGHGMDANLVGGGFKHFNIDGFIEVVESQNWKEWGAVQLWIKGGEEGMNDSLFELVKLRRRKPTRHKSDAVSPKAKRRSRTSRDGGRA